MTTKTQTQVTLSDGQQAPIVTKTPLLNDGDVESKRQEILDYFHDSFTLYESLFECLDSDEAFYHRANRLRQPLIFYYGHTSVFFINKLNVANLIDERVDPTLESILAIGVDEMSWDDLNDDNYQWPTPQQVKAHRDATRDIVDRFIRDCDFSMPIDWQSPMWIVLMGIEHERIHLETSSILIRELPLDMTKPHPVWSEICRDDDPAPVNELIEVHGDSVALGKSQSNPIYGWDCEYGTTTEEVKSYRASKYLVSNQEMLDFIEAGGYQNETYWSPEGQKWIDFSKAEHPVYWIKEDEGYRLRTMLEVIDMPWAWPAEINYLEAKAFCNWKSEQTGTHIRMPSEAEWHLLRNGLDTDQPYWDSAPGNLNLEHELSPCPVDRHEFHDGFYDVIGNVWQWTETPIDAHDGFEVHPVYDDFSAPTFDGKHNLFKGGCWISTGNYAIKDARYAFRRHFFQYSGLRYVAADPLPETETNLCETDPQVAQSLDSHYGKTKLSVDNFQVACVAEIEAHLVGRETGRALDIGCGSGRASFELAKLFQHVDAVDFSVRLIEGPTNLQKSGRQRYSRRSEGELKSFHEILLDSFSGYRDVQERISFMQADACNLVDKFNDYDLVLAANLIEWLYDPANFLKSMKQRVRSGGLLAIASNYNWNEENTPREKWLGGFKANTGENFTSLEGIEEILAPEFELVTAPVDIPLVLQNSDRDFSYGVSELSVWQKKS